MNPHALPFRPVAGPPHHEEQHNGSHPPVAPSHFAGPPWRAHNAPPQSYSTGPAHAPWDTNYAQMSHYDTSDHQAYADYAAQVQAHARYHQWAQYYGYLGYPPQHPPYYGAPSAFAQQGLPHLAAAHHHALMQAQVNAPQGIANEQVQDTPSDPELDEFIRAIDGDGTAKQKKKKKEKEKDMPPSEPRAMSARERRKDPKIMLPAPPPTQQYLDQAAEEPSNLDTPGHILVILDLNGTLIYRPNRNAKSMIARPFLKPFLRYLFSNFSVMVWSSARPHNVQSLVAQCLDKELRSMLVAAWARDSFGLSEQHYNLNVQVYKNLDLVWNSNIQHKHPQFAAGQRFGQHNTVLIDDSPLKANAQPYNLLEIPEFKADHMDAKQDVLREVAGYLEALRTQADVSKFIRKDPFKFDGRWQYNWSDQTADAEGGELKSKVSLNAANVEGGDLLTNVSPTTTED